MSQSQPSESLLQLDPDLGQLLSPERMSAASAELRVRVRSLQSGAWRPGSLTGHSAAGLGILIIDGVLAREIRVHDAPSAELFGPGDIIRTTSAETSLELLQCQSRWQALTPLTIAVLEAPITLILQQRYPEVCTVVFDRFNARGQRLALTQAISQITGVDTRVEALLWHLAGRWGRVGRDQMIVPIPLSHSLIGALVGARRPTVSSALARLAARDRVQRRPDGRWVLPGMQPPADLAPAERAHPVRVLSSLERPVSRVAA
jgi:CRP-like cAMP-binding protein